MKIAISGKGGVGKTTLSALLARTLAEGGRPVIAVDADPDANLAAALGLAPEESPEPISGMKQLIRERTGSQEGYGSYFKMNPEVRDIPERFSKIVNGVRLLTLGGVARGGGGCICPESVLLRALVTNLLLKPGEVVILDMEAGIEHLGRGTAEAVSAMVVVVEPGRASCQTARSIGRLAGEIRIPRLGAVINKVPEGLDLAAITSHLGDIPVLGTLSADPAIARADFEGRSPYPGSEAQRAEVRAILEAVEKLAGPTA